MNRPVDHLSDGQLAALNAALPWKTSTRDANGREVGLPGGPPYTIPAELVVMTDMRFGLAGKSVVEFGCLEGAHTVALAERAGSVLAVDARVDNLLKSSLRCAMYGVFPRFSLLDVEERMPPPAEVYFHSGVLYHLQDPVIHLRRVCGLASALVLDTHHARVPDTGYTSADGGSYRAWVYRENVSGAKAGVRDFSRWIPLQTIMDILAASYAKVEVVSDRVERNGPRATIYACHRRPGP